MLWGLSSLPCSITHPAFTIAKILAATWSLQRLQATSVLLPDDPEKVCIAIADHLTCSCIGPNVLWSTGRLTRNEGVSAVQRYYVVQCMCRCYEGRRYSRTWPVAFHQGRYISKRVLTANVQAVMPEGLVQIPMAARLDAPFRWSL